MPENDGVALERVHDLTYGRRQAPKNEKSLGCGMLPLDNNVGCCQSSLFCHAKVSQVMHWLGEEAPAPNLG